VILLDTCAIIWDALSPESLSRNAKEAIEKADQQNALIISDISLWEVAMLIQKERLRTSAPASHLLNLFLASRSIAVRAINPDIAELSVNFGPDMNKDPADRIIAATAIVNNAKLVTADQNLIANPMLDTVW
jgi:PIN domain nuclease of toxin-antitoxin system